jgi:3-deoxy-7-phosphoheptulonate synthase
MILDSKLPSPNSLFKKLPLSIEGARFVSTSINNAKKIVAGTSSKLAIIVGPCSIHSIESALLYAEKLKKLSLCVEETLFLVMRVYVEKPRTTIGWKGFLYDPFLNGTDNLAKGLFFVRKLFIDLANLEIPTATEFLNPLSAPFYQDLVTWGFIGARTTTSQIHRELASSLPFPVGFKNTQDGNLLLPINSMISANTSHTFFGMNVNGNLSSLRSNGNPFCHLVLRGSDFETNFDKESIEFASKLQALSGITQRIMIDCAHGNSRKNHIQEKEVFKKIVEDFFDHSTPLSGIMFESFLESGNQTFKLASSHSKTLSITDPCIGWTETEELILEFHEKLLNYRSRINMEPQPA